MDAISERVRWAANCYAIQALWKPWEVAKKLDSGGRPRVILPESPLRQRSSRLVAHLRLDFMHRYFEEW